MAGKLTAKQSFTSQVKRIRPYKERLGGPCKRPESLKRSGGLNRLVGLKRDSIWKGVPHGNEIHVELPSTQKGNRHGKGFRMEEDSTWKGTPYGKETI
ncbi:hypothetical protein T310_1412 [Rasamsonia emersonii CBS 393.64]|uniref:Uncharacterized protein n=1 Tax=Rasamsonia emersonii (strain ATCC 16479 / CBS 393.64 / IMI 116815) TaxID=1408163 RepID=A0A0F4Z343_RASE3|nr:hypothetical protein T310_1412 [Rasamsonia emersonii CBS 393.64]KKA24511.1 hypothetical protein T310_1412 [Rasamsonia emersonii CBS 393.64]